MFNIIWKKNIPLKHLSSPCLHPFINNAYKKHFLAFLWNKLRNKNTEKKVLSFWNRRFSLARCSIFLPKLTCENVRNTHERKRRKKRMYIYRKLCCFWLVFVLKLNSIRIFYFCCCWFFIFCFNIQFYMVKFCNLLA